MTSNDPIHAEWAATADRVASGHADAGTIGLAAMTGLFSLAEPVARHLGEDSCYVCEGVLRETWAIMCPPAYVAQEIATMSPTSSMQRALTEHAETCGNPSCIAARDVILAPDASSVTASTWEERGANLATRLGAALVRRLRPELSAFGGAASVLLGSEPSASQESARVTGELKFGAHVTLSPVAGGGPGIVLRADVDGLRQDLAGDGDILVIVLDHNDETIKAGIRFAGGGIQETRMNLDPQLLRTGEPRIIVALGAPRT